MEQEAPKRRGRPPKVKEVKPRVWESKDLVLKIGAFIPGQEPQEITITVERFAGNTLGRQKTVADIKEKLKKALQDIYGGTVK